MSKFTRLDLDELYPLGTQMSTQKNEHNPMSQERLICKPDGHNSNVWYIGTHDELLVATVNHICAEDFAKGLVDAWNRRITPPTETTGKPDCARCFGYGWISRPVEGVRCDCCPDTTGSGREGDTPETDAVVYKWSVDGNLHPPVENELYKHARQLERQRDAALAVIRQTALDTADPSDDLETKRRIIHKRCRAAIDSAQRQEGSKADYSAANPHEC